MSVKGILIGWSKTLGILRTTVGESMLSRKRLKICENCMESKSSKVLEIINGNVNMVDTLSCTRCSCPCKQKSLVKDEACPLKKW